MNADIIESYIEKVYGYAINHTFSREEADELSQEILFTVVRELPKLKDDRKFEPPIGALALGNCRQCHKSIPAPHGTAARDVFL